MGSVAYSSSQASYLGTGHDSPLPPPFSGQVLPESNTSQGSAQDAPADAPSADASYVETFEGYNDYIDDETLAAWHNYIDDETLARFHGQLEAEQLGTEQPGTEQPGTEQPGTEQPGTEQPAKPPVVEDPWRRRFATGEFDQQ
ncbi:hypothetical protein FRC10_006673 [Ceratobasidium sp. 414]|nr:hypothetical protein FRC10_006673 [Ceratobasidium sp. 414]